MTTSAKSPDSKTVDLVLRVGVSVALLGVIAWRTDVRRIAAVFAHMKPEYIPAILVLIYGAIVIAVMKWGLLVRARNLEIKVGSLFDFYLIGMFFNNFLPTSIGGDVVQGYEMARRTGKGHDAAATILSDRLIASAALGLTALVGLIAVPRTPRLVALVIAFAAGTMAVAWAFAHPKLTRTLVERQADSRMGTAGGWAARTAGVVRELLRDRRLVVRAALMALVFQCTLALINIVIFKALGETIDIGHALVYVPMISALTVLPISLSGLGVREAAYVYFFTRVGVSGPNAVAASLIFFVAVAVASLPGAALLVMARRREPSEREDVPV